MNVAERRAIALELQELLGHRWKVKASDRWASPQQVQVNLPYRVDIRIRADRTISTSSKRTTWKWSGLRPLEQQPKFEGHYWLDRIIRFVALEARRLEIETHEIKRRTA